MNLGFADALRRRLGPTWPPQQHCADWVSASSAFATLRRHFCRSRRCQKEELLLLLLGLLCLLRLLRFLRHIALQAMSEWRHRNDAHPKSTCIALRLLPQQKKNSESPNKQFAIATHARVVVRRMHARDQRALALRVALHCVSDAFFASSPEIRMAQGFLRCRLLRAQRELGSTIVIARSLDVNASRKRRRDFHRPNFFAQDALALACERRSREQNERISAK